MKKEIEDFIKHAINHYKYTLEGDWKKGNVEIKKINTIYESIKKQGTEAQNELLELIYFDKPEVSLLSATYSMTFNPIECLTILKELSKKNIPHISSASKQAIQNWNNNEWYIN